MVLHEPAQGPRVGTWDDPVVVPGNSLAFLFNPHHDELLGDILSAREALLLAPEDLLVDLGGPGYGVVARALHGLHHLSTEPPKGLLSRVQLAGQLGGGEPFFVGGQEIHYPKGLDQVELDLVEERPGHGGFHIAAPRALARVRRGAPAAVSVAAFGTLVAVGPFEGRPVGKAAVVAREPGLKFEDR